PLDHLVVSRCQDDVELRLRRRQVGRLPRPLQQAPREGGQEVNAPMHAPAVVRQTLRLHTIDEWVRVDPMIRAEIVKHIKLKDRLPRWLLARRQEKVTSPHWVKCGDCEGRGHILVEPRYDGIHPSQLPHPCMLKIFHEMTGNAAGDSAFEPRMLL